MAKVYIVTSGDYSGYGIDAVFSTREVARQYITLMGGEYVEEWDLDAHLDKYSRGLLPWRVIMERDGKSRSSSRESVDLANQNDTRLTHYLGVPEGVYTMITYMWAKDEEHAVKIANERRAQLIARNQWVPAIEEAV
jgi:hypothetical protein